MMNLRNLWLFPGIVVFVAGLVAEEHPAKATTWQDAPQSLAIAAVPNLPSVAGTIKRNPFDGAPSTVALATSSPSALANVPTPGLTPMPGTPTTGIGVPNPGGNLDIGSTGDPSAVVAANSTTSMIYVISTVVGDGRPPLAMLQNGPDTDIVGIGDMIGRHRITRIVPQGIEFDDGSRLAVAAAPASDASGNTTGGNQNGQNGQTSLGTMPAPQVNQTTPQPNTTEAPQPAATSGASAPNGPPVINPSPYTFGPLATPQPGTTPAPVPHFYPPPAGQQ
jgi:hypothetical protein